MLFKYPTKSPDLCACPPIRRDSSFTRGITAGKGRRRTVCSMMSASLCCRTFYNRHTLSHLLSISWVLLTTNKTDDPGDSKHGPSTKSIVFYLHAYTLLIFFKLHLF